MTNLRNAELDLNNIISAIVAGKITSADLVKKLKDVRYNIKGEDEYLKTKTNSKCCGSCNMLMKDNSCGHGMLYNLQYTDGKDCERFEQTKTDLEILTDNHLFDSLSTNLI